MKKNKVTRKSCSISYEPLENVIELASNIMAREYENGGPSTFKDFSIGFNYDFENEYPVLEYQTLETDEEYTERIRKEKYWDQVRDARDREQYEALKKKFGDK